MTYRHTFTVFTPTYNRAHTLPRVYGSLKEQTFRNFEWIIVDDGSEDNTSQLVAKWRITSDFPIRYFWQENGGKHRARNRAVAEAQGEFFFTWDSDDICVPNALELMKGQWDAIPDIEKATFAGVAGLCARSDGAVVGSRFPRDVFDSDMFSVRQAHRVEGEKCGFQRTDVLRQFPFPQLQQRHYLPESLVWDKIARHYKTRFVNDRLRIYYMDRPSMVHGQAAGKNAVGGQMQHAGVLNEEIDYLRYAPLEFLRSAVHFVRFSFHVGTGIAGQWRRLCNVRARLLWGLMLPVGWLVFQRDRRR